MQYLEIAISKRSLYGIQDGDLMRLFWRDAMRNGGIDPDQPWTQDELSDRYVIRQEVIAASPASTALESAANHSDG